MLCFFSFGQQKLTFGAMASNDDGDDTITTMAPSIVTEPTILPAGLYESAGNMRSPQINTATTIFNDSGYNVEGDGPDIHFPIDRGRRHRQLRWTYWSSHFQFTMCVIGFFLGYLCLSNTRPTAFSGPKIFQLQRPSIHKINDIRGCTSPWYRTSTKHRIYIHRCISQFAHTTSTMVFTRTQQIKAYAIALDLLGFGTDAAGNSSPAAKALAAAVLSTSATSPPSQILPSMCFLIPIKLTMSMLSHHLARVIRTAYASSTDT
mmetsp:Transcript_10408/g.24952  ORF Transcript_10408/g.24952 Transcript_10408/m.24952 type:complete len:262 (-) Transcript_10408:473-1258(-)